MGFTLPRTRLAFKHLRSLSCQRLELPATLTTWVSTLYMRLTDSLEFQDVILTWILTKLYNEAPAKPSWNYVLTMRHHHELPPKRVMELRPDHEAPPWDLTKRFMKLRPKPYQNHASPTQHRIFMHTNLMPIYITNHPIMLHTKDHTKLINSSPCNQNSHAYSHSLDFK